MKNGACLEENIVFEKLKHPERSYTTYLMNQGSNDMCLERFSLGYLTNC